MGHKEETCKQNVNAQLHLAYTVLAVRNLWTGMLIFQKFILSSFIKTAHSLYFQGTYQFYKKTFQRG